VTRAITLWRNQDFVVLWRGGLISVLGSGVSRIAYPLLMLAVTHSPAQAGLAGGLRALPYLLLGLPAGALVDRWNRKQVMILCDAGRSLNMASIPLAFALGHFTAAQLYGNALVGGILFVFFSAAEVAYLPHIVSREQLSTAVAVEQGMSSGAEVVAPSLGGILFQFGHVVPFLTDAVSYSASVVSLLFVKAEFQEKRATDVPNLRKEIVEGLRWLWQQPLVRTVAITTAGLQLATSGVALIVIILAQHHHASPAMIGTLFSAVGIGGVLGSAIAPRVQRTLGFGRTILGVAWTEALLWPLFAFAPNPVMLGVVLGLFAFSMPIYGVAAMSYRLSVTPDRLQSRVGTAFRVIAWSSEPLGAVLAGLLIQALGAVSTTLVFSAWVLLVAAITSSDGQLRRAIRQREAIP